MIGQVEEQITGPAWNLETGELATPSRLGAFSGPDGTEVVKVRRAYLIPRVPFPARKPEGGAIAPPGFSGSAINGEVVRRHITYST